MREQVRQTGSGFVMSDLSLVSCVPPRYRVFREVSIGSFFYSPLGTVPASLISLPTAYGYFQQLGLIYLLLER